MSKNHTIMEVVNLSRSIIETHYTKPGIPQSGPVLIGLGSGLDVALTIMEESVGTFSGLPPEAAERIVICFNNESSKYKPLDLEIAVWYAAWAEAIEKLFLQKVENE